MDKLLLIDGNSIMNRAFYGTQSGMLQNAEGLFTGAVFGFLNIFLKVVGDEKPSHIAVAFDLKAPTFRHKMYDGYKATRKGMPPELAEQMPVIKEVLSAMNCTCLELEGYEADDIIGTCAKIARDNGIKCIILTGDKDSLQLVTENTNVLLPVTKQGTTVVSVMTPDAVREKLLGVSPEQVVDMKALMGDSSDNIPGVPGVGEKTAAQLLCEFSSLENIYANVENIKKNALRQKLIENKELAYLSQTLARINCDVPLAEIPCCEGESFCIDKLAIKEYDYPILYKLFVRLEFKQLIKKLKLEELATANAASDFSENIGSDDVDAEAAKIHFLDKPYLDILMPDDIQKINISDACEYLYIEYTCDEVDGSVSTLDLYDGGELFYRIDLGFLSMETLFLEKTRAVFENTDIKKCFFKAKDFVLWLRRNGIEMQGLWCDISIAAYLADSTRRNDTLGEACRYFTGADAEGIGVMPYTAQKAFDLLESNDMTELYVNVELPLVDVLVEFEYRGFTVSKDVLIEEGKAFGDRITELTEKIYGFAGHEFNINSPKQLGEVLFEELKLPGGKKSKTGYKTGQEVLEKLVSEHPIVPLIMEYRQNAKLKSTYIDGFVSVINPATGKVHSNFNQTVTATGRLSSSEPNLQNIPTRHELGRLIRKAFFASAPGRVLIDADYSQIELRLLADMSGDTTMVKAFNDNEDIHAITASQVNGVPLSEVTPRMRSEAKAVNFGIVYGISEFGLAKDLDISWKEAKGYIDGYFKKYPQVHDFLNDLISFAKRKGYAETPFGRRRYLPELSSSKYMIRQFGERVAMNMPIQGAAADIMKMAMVSVYKELKRRKLNSHLILQVHDELLIDAAEEEAEEVKQLLKECMENVVELSVPLPVSVSMGYCWNECNK